MLVSIFFSEKECRILDFGSVLLGEPGINGVSVSTAEDRGPGRAGVGRFRRQRR